MAPFETMRAGRPETQKRRGRHAFTLIEIMIAVSIMAIIMTVGIPLAWRALQKNDLARAVHDTMEGLKIARDRAILQGVPYEFVVREDGQLNVVPATLPRVEGEPPPAAAKSTVDSPYAAFPRQLGEDVMVQLIDVNFVDHMQMPEARVRFHPNATCDEFTVVYAYEGKQRVITVDIVTGIPEEITPR